MPHPVSDTYLDVQTARALAVLPAAGAWDAAPLVLQCPGFDYVTLYITYTRGGAGGSVELAVDVNDDALAGAWHQTTIYSPGTVAVNTDTSSNVQREGVLYGATGAATETVVYGPIHIGATIERLRILAREVGAVATPGTCYVEAHFASEE